ncbi:MAG: hypothetical protein Q9165_008458 [Trypethelium subeluteriae]
MPSKKGSSGGLSTSRKAGQSTGQSRPTRRSQTQATPHSGELTKSASRQKIFKNIQPAVLQGSKRHTRKSHGSPILKARDDIQKLTYKRKPKLEEASPVETATSAEPRLETHHGYQEPHVPGHFDQPLPSIEEASEAGIAEQQDLSDFHLLSSCDLRSESTLSVDGSTGSDVVSWLRGPSDAEDTFLQRSGYIVPLSNEALTAIRVLLGKEAALRMGSIAPNSSEFRTALRLDRKVLLDETKWSDPEWEYLKKYDFGQKADEDSITHFLDKLWQADLDFCRDQQEALFQRTIMMAMINRHQLIFAGIKMPSKLPERALMFSVEATWSCPPMPTRKYERKVVRNKAEPKTFTTLPKPDLCVSFRTCRIIDSDDWELLPPETQHLICYEGIANEKSEGDRAFGFFFVEAKRSRLPPDDGVALCQVLNDASQALHNMYEFFREAEQTSVFFDHVRVFSATTSEQGVIIRVHWASKLPDDPFKRIVPDYPLQFEHQTYMSFRGTDFDRLGVVRVFESVMVGYGERRLLKLLQTAAAKVKEKVRCAWQNRERVPISQAFNDYRYGQIGMPSSRATSRPQTPAIVGTRPAAANPMPPPNRSPSMRASPTSAKPELMDRDREERTPLSQGFAKLQTNPLASQSSVGQQTSPREITPTKQGDNPKKKRKTRPQ